MAEKPQPDPVPVEDPPPHPAEPLQLETPVIDMQDLEHQPGSATRVSNKGVRITPTMEKLAHHSRKEDEAAIAALERLEKSMR
jgi:hypothetical protein